MTATDELRRMLDEQGVEWHCVDMRTGEERSNITEWNVPNAGWVEATELGGHLTYSWHMGEKPTPEQAIAATLGRRTTTRHGKFRTKYGRSVPCCECCGYGIGDTRWNYCPSCGAEVVE